MIRIHRPSWRRASGNVYSMLVVTPRDLKVLHVLHFKVSPTPNGHFPPLTLRCGMVLRLHGFATNCSINNTCTKITKLTSVVTVVQVLFMLQIASKTCKRKTMPHLKVKGGKCPFDGGETFKRNTCNTLRSRGVSTARGYSVQGVSSE